MFSLKAQNQPEYQNMEAPRSFEQQVEDYAAMVAQMSDDQIRNWRNQGDATQAARMEFIKRFPQEWYQDGFEGVNPDKS